MLVELSVANLGVVGDGQVQFPAGMTVITGETGAGKTLVVEALQLLLGARADPVMVGPAGDEARVDGRFLAPPPVVALLGEAGIDFDAELVISRRLPASGPSRGWINGRPVTARTLAEVGQRLVAVHGQHAHQRLLATSAARDLVDQRASEERAAYAVVWERWRTAAAALEGLGGTPAERARDADLLRHQVREIASAAPTEGEDAELEARIERLGHADELRDAATTAWGETGAAEDALGRAVAALRAAPGTEHDDLAATAAVLQDEIAELTRALRGQAEALEDDPTALEAALERRAVVRDIARKYGPTIADVEAFAAGAQRRLDELKGYEERATALEEDAARSRRELEGAGVRLREARRRAAAVIVDEMTVLLRELSLPDARLSVDVAPVEPGPGGADRVTLLFSANPGLALQPVAKVASGGELSRLMLAMELTAADPSVPTVVFDEVDAGVSGKAGASVGRLLAALGRRAQVICVTHLAQVAAHAAGHVAVRKRDGEAAVGLLAGAERVAELSRMLAGQEESASARAHAVELLEDARRVAESGAR